MALRAVDLTFAHPGRPPLFAGVHLRVEPGEIVGLTGPSGAGKSTLGGLLAGHLRPARGGVLVDGSPLRNRGVRPVQLIHQQPEHAVNPRWRMRDILAESYLLSDADLRCFGIDLAWLDRWPAEVSGGELQRFCIARALHPATRYLIADEITAKFDAVTQALMWEVVVDVARARELGVVVISHEQALLDRVCDRQIDVTRLATRADDPQLGTALGKTTRV